MTTPKDPSPETAAVPEAGIPDNLTDALSQFVLEKKNSRSAKVSMDGHQEIIRFIEWYGRDRKMGDLAPSLVEDYAKEFAQRGADAQKKLLPLKAFLLFMHKREWTELNLSTHLRAIRSRKTAGSRQAGGALNAANGPRLSEEGYNRLVAELEGFREERVRVVEDIKRAMADKDYRENAPLDAAKERQGFVEAKIRELESELTNAQILSKTGEETDKSRENVVLRAVVGSSITVKDVDTKRIINYTLVDKREADIAAGKISTVSPVGQALLDRAVGDEVEIIVPKGTMRYLVEKIGA